MTGFRIASLVLLVTFEQASAQQLPRLRRTEGVTPLQHTFGQAVAAVGDVDQDGVDDYVVGSPDETVGNAVPAQYRGVARSTRVRPAP